MMWNNSAVMEVYDHPDYPIMASHSVGVYAVIVILSFFSVVGTAGNALVLYVFYQKKDKQISTMFIIVLAIVDFTTCLVIIPYTIILESQDYLVPYDFLCKFYQFLITSNIPFSALIMVAIAIDRYFCICHPFLHALNLRRAKIMTCCLALCSITLGITVSLMYGVYDRLKNVYMNVPPSFRNGNTQFASDDNTTRFNNWGSVNSSAGGGINDSSGSGNNSQPMFVDDYNIDHDKVVFVGQCQANELIVSKDFLWWYQRFYASLYLICLVIVIVLYVLIYRSVLTRRNRRARQKSKALPLVQHQNETCPASTVEETLLTQVNGDEKIKECPNGNTDKSTKGKVAKGSLSRTSTKKDNNRMANLKTAAMLFVVTVVFIVTFLPAFLMVIELIDYNIILFYMYFANNVANPVIYSFMNKNFRDDLMKIFCSPRAR